MTATIHHLPTVRRPTAPPSRPSHVTRLCDYRLTFSRGWLRWGPYYRRLTADEACDLAGGIWTVLTASSKGRPLMTEPVPGIVLIGENPRVTVRGFGPALDWVRAGELMKELHEFYVRRVAK